MKKMCIVTSSGGHLVKTYYLKMWWSKYDRLWVTRKDALTNNLLRKEKVVYGFFPENRHLGNFVLNLWLAWRLFKKERPDILFSMGAGIAPPFFLVAKCMGIKTVFMETFISIPRTTLSGRLIYPFADLFLVQNIEMIRKYPKAKYWGSVL